MGCTTSSLSLVTNGHFKRLHKKVAADDVNGTVSEAVPCIEEVDKSDTATAKELYCDEEFSAVESSIGDLQDEIPTEPEWRRPHEICDNPELFVEGSGRCDVMQGLLGDCWILAAMSGLAQHPHLMNKVLDPKQVLCGPDYDGCIRVNLWKYGRWITVVIDDRLPVTKTEDADGYSFLFSSCASSNEFWVPILEKAIAKLHTTYAALNGGACLEALTLLTGGVSYPVELGTEEPNVLSDLVTTALQGKAMVTCSKINPDEGGDETESNTGLVSNHAYSVTGATEVTLSDESSTAVSLVRVRNPYGDSTEWTGAWSDGDAMWDEVIPEVRKALEAELAIPDGEFWMSIEDFRYHFYCMTICNLMPDLDGDGDGDDVVSGQIMEGVWDQGGPDTNFQQYLLRLDPISEGETTSLVIALMQEPVRGTGRDDRFIGFTIHEVEEDVSSPFPIDELPEQKFENPGPAGISELTERYQLSSGSYVVLVMVADLEPEEKRGFLLRAYASTGLSLTHLAS